MRDPTKGLEMLRSLAKESPDTEGVHYRLGFALLYLNRPVAEAVTALEEAARRDPTYVTLITLGEAHLRGEAHEKAAAVFDRASRIQPANAEPLVKKALALEKSGDVDGAKETWEAARGLSAQVPTWDARPR